MAGFLLDQNTNCWVASAAPVGFGRSLKRTYKLPCAASCDSACQCPRSKPTCDAGVCKVGTVALRWVWVPAHGALQLWRAAAGASASWTSWNKPHSSSWLPLAPRAGHVRCGCRLRHLHLPTCHPVSRVYARCVPGSGWCEARPRECEAVQSVRVYPSWQQELGGGAKVCCCRCCW